MLNYNEVLPKKYIVLDEKPYEVLSSHVFRKQQRKPVNQTRLRNLITGKVIEHSFHQSDKIEEAEIEKKGARFLYSHRGEVWLCEEGNPGKRFNVQEKIIGDQTRFLKQNTPMEMLSFNGEAIGFKLPIKVDLIVKEAPPAVKGDTAQGAIKQATLETGATVNVPIFIKEGDVVRVNTETGDYVERV